MSACQCAGCWFGRYVVAAAIAVLSAVIYYGY